MLSTSRGVGGIKMLLLALDDQPRMMQSSSAKRQGESVIQAPLPLSKVRVDRLRGPSASSAQAQAPSVGG